MLYTTVLGNSAATPAFSRHPSAQVLTMEHGRFLVDCGEGTQMQMQRYKVKPAKIKAIFISHLHGDHYLGLMGLLLSMHLQGREQALKIFAPRPLKDVLTTEMRCSETKLNYELSFEATPEQSGEIIYEDSQCVVSSVILKHRIFCCGFRFSEKHRKRKVLVDKLPADLPKEAFKALKNGEDFWEGSRQMLFRAEDYSEAKKPRSFAYCSDTCYYEDILPHIEGVDLLYHESTFLDSEQARAEVTFHSTASQAASIAKQAGAGKLILGHFSSRYHDLSPFLEESRAIFPDTYLGLEGEHYYPKSST